MQRLPNGSIRYSPRDLIAFLEGDFAAWCERSLLENSAASSGGATFAPDESDEELELAARKGMEHEAAYATTLRTRYPDLVEIAGGDSSTDETLAAMRRGVTVIYQGHLEHDGWHGYPDFLLRVDGASSLGPFHYEPVDTKLARTAKPYFIVQLAAYAEMLAAVQGIAPARLGFVFGNGAEQWFTHDRFVHYFRQLKSSFLSFQKHWNAAAIPEPGLDRSYGRWTAYAQALLAESDHLSRVANISRSQIDRLKAAGIGTFAALATTARDTIPGMKATTLDRLRRQARLQHAAQPGEPPPFELRARADDEPRCGLALLPPPSPGDVFFDLEGYPFAIDGLEYLWGAATPGDPPAFNDWWAHDAAEERRAFEQFIDWAYGRWKQDPSMHIYHYSSYEVSAVKRLAQRYGTREFHVDEFLRRGVFVDLFTVVRQGLIIGTPSYSLKEIEHLYLAPRDGSVVNAAGSVVEYQRWLDSGEPTDWRASPILDGIRDYNRVDCQSTLQLRDWLHDRQRESDIAYVPAPDSSADKAPMPANDNELIAQKLRQIADSTTDPERARVTRLLSFLVEFHRREAKPMWWRYFEWLSLTEDELFDDDACLAGLERTDAPPRRIKLSNGMEYRFDPDQETKLHQGAAGIVVSLDPAIRKSIEIVTFDPVRGLLELKVGPRRQIADRLHLMPDEQVSSSALAAAVLRYATAYSNGDVRSQAVDDLLYRRPPRITGYAGGPLIPEGAPMPDAVIDLVRRLDHGTLCIQGPPGTGKTRTAAAVITDLVRAGKRVGVAAHSHKVIMNLLCAIEQTMQAKGVAGALLKVGGIDGAPPRSAIREVANAGAEAAARTPGVVIAGTAWLFSRDGMVDALDYLFVDEAGQVPLANAVAMAQSAANLVLIGDQMQLSQPMQGSHPEESGTSGLGYLLERHATIPAELGVFLGTSHRMHPDVCRFISDAFYEGRLTSAPATASNRVLLPPDASVLSGTGVVYLPVESDGCERCSEEEVDVIERVVGDLLRSDVMVAGKPLRKMALNDILIVAPFNAQVRLLLARIPGGRIGTVDRFQGQEAAAVIVSMCASTIEEAPRGAEFLLSPNRLNVAISRAQALAIVVGSSRLATARVKSVTEMELVDGWCRVGARVG